MWGWGGVHDRTRLDLFNNSHHEVDVLLNAVYFLCISTAAQHKPGVMCSAKLVATNPMLSRSYNVAVAPRAASATQIARDLLHTHGIRGLYRGLGATIMR